MPDEETIRRKQNLLAAEMQRYFGHTCAELTARWEAAMLMLRLSVLRELARKFAQRDR